jgi:calreticulin
LATTEDSRFYGLSKAFDESFSNKDMDQVVLQYQVKYDKDLECGGGYMKIGPKQDDLKAFGDPTPYNIMFGPDKCGYTERTHLIFNYKGTETLCESPSTASISQEEERIITGLVIDQFSLIMYIV